MPTGHVADNSVSDHDLVVSSNKPSLETMLTKISYATELYIFKLHMNEFVSIKILLKCVPKDLIAILALVLNTAWR